MSLASGNNLGSESSHCALSKILVIVLGNVNLFLNSIELLNSDLTCIVETIGDLKWMDTLIEKLLGLLENGSS